MIKFATFVALLALASAVSVRPAQRHPPSYPPAPAPAAPAPAAPAPAAPAPAAPAPSDDILVTLASGTTTAANGDNAVGAAADTDSGAVGAKGGDAAFGLAGPGLAVGGGSTFGTQSAGETPSMNIFSLFN